MNIINRPKKMGLKPETIKRFKDKFKASEIEQENKKFERSKFKLDKYGFVSKEVNEEYDDYDIY